MTPREVLARHGSSFYTASRLLRSEDARDIATLYAVCRLVDDLADEHNDAGDRIKPLLQALEARTPEAIPVDGFAEMVHRRDLDLEPLRVLAANALQESADNRLIADEAELLDYCYAVAGTVGEIMCPLLGADPDKGREAAIALGTAMQLTNIARDVQEDAEQGRRYLPGEWLGDLSPATIAAARPIHREPVRGAIRRVVELAETQYAIGESGLGLIPFRNRQAIRVATQLYRAIGLRVVDQGCEYWRGRVSLTARERATLAVQTVGGLVAGRPRHSA